MSTNGAIFSFLRRDKSLRATYETITCFFFSPSMPLKSSTHAFAGFTSSLILGYSSFPTSRRLRISPTHPNSAGLLFLSRFSLAFIFSTSSLSPYPACDCSLSFLSSIIIFSSSLFYWLLASGIQLKRSASAILRSGMRIFLQSTTLTFLPYCEFLNPVYSPWLSTITMPILPFSDRKRRRYFAKRYAHLFAVHHAHVPSILRIPKSGVFPVAVNYHNAHPALFIFPFHQFLYKDACKVGFAAA